MVLLTENLNFGMRKESLTKKDFLTERNSSKEKNFILIVKKKIILIVTDFISFNLLRTRLPAIQFRNLCRR